jgi:hypothetical protein
MEPGDSSPHSHKPSIGPYPEPDRSNPFSNKKQKQKTIINVGLHITDVTATTGLHIETTDIEQKQGQS